MKELRTIIITGVSGGGKTTALRAVEDLGFYCVDNLPLSLLWPFIHTMEQEVNVDRVALVVDVRLQHYLEQYAQAFGELHAQGQAIEVLYFYAQDEVLIRRFSQTRRRHPLAPHDLRQGLAEEHRLLAPIRAEAHLSLDTSEMTPHQLRQIISDRYEAAQVRLGVTVLSFGFRYGIPAEADIVLDVRFLANPYFIDELRHQTGQDESVANFVLQTSDAQTFLQHAEEMLRFLLPRYESEGKAYLTIAIGCTGGQHRSVALSTELARRLAQTRSIQVRHRDITR